MKASKDDAFLQAFRIAAAHFGTPVTQLEGETATLRMGEVLQEVSLTEPRLACEGLFPGERARVLEGYLKAFAALSRGARPETFEEVRDRVLPRVSPRLPGAEELPSIPLLAESLELYFVVNEPTRMRFVGRADLSLWGKELSDLLPLAALNLRARTNWQLLRWVEAPPGVGFFPPVDAFVAARMLLLRDALRPWPSLGAIVAVPDRSVLAIAPIGGRKILGRLDEIAKAAGNASPRRGLPITSDLLWFDGATWERIPVAFEGDQPRATPTTRLVDAVGAA